ncbi:hypothetical protein NUW54_g14763 [Trametes sanguinea]|uniref:Uncharacterized protein n=1 Tax=Trametes sanguinea TaxID=158606 RepID=A0ACC1MBD7_9APHY|nr:hypothetical protein NUW54_g14763 [Trametes sanguinea]
MNGFGSLVRNHEDNKWGKMYRMMTEQRIGILLIQETHLTSARCDELHRMFANRIKIWHSECPEAPTMREGVAVVLNKRIISAEGAKATEVIPGRAIQLEVTWRGGDKRHLLCVYAPTSGGQKERGEFFAELGKFYEERPDMPRPDIMAGDFNNTEDPRDRSPPQRREDTSVRCLGELKSKLDLMAVDGWRRTNPDKRDFTFFRGTGDAATMSRLDRIYVNENSAKWTKEWDITPQWGRADRHSRSICSRTRNLRRK